jgi:hypothetical protein
MLKYDLSLIWHLSFDWWMDGWMDGRTDGWMDGWMIEDGWMDGWISATPKHFRVTCIWWHPVYIGGWESKCNVPRDHSHIPSVSSWQTSLHTSVSSSSWFDPYTPCLLDCGWKTNEMRWLLSHRSSGAFRSQSSYFL